MGYSGSINVDSITGRPVRLNSSGSGTSGLGKYLIGVEGDLSVAPGNPGQAKALEQLQALGIQPTGIYRNVGIVVAELTPGQATQLKGSEGISFVERNQRVWLLPDQGGAAPAARGGKGGAGSSEPPPPVDDYLDWGVKTVVGGTPTTISSPESKVAWVIDSGVSPNTNDLNLNTSLSRGFDASGADNSNFADQDGHGTHVGGTIAALDNGKGTIGVAPGASVVALRVFFPGEATYDDRIIAAINYAIGEANSGDTNVINMSLGRRGGIEGSAYLQAIERAVGAGFELAIAAGNDSADADGYSPASAGDLDGVYTVSAAGRYAPNPKKPNSYVATTDEKYPLVMAHFSNYDDNGDGNPVDDVAYAAPGLLITSLGLNGERVQLSGTSMASPHMAGALLWGQPKAGQPISPFFANYNGAADPDPLLLLL